ncbi:MAG TPA: hypothetical protein VLC52_14025, partial [Anaerolineae bacterium]|nr:hypothetical protein [Anaerolineae bacterium]
MAKYEYLRLSPRSTSSSNTYLTIVSTDSYVVDYVVALISKFVRQLSVVTKKDFDDQRYTYTLRQLDGKEE